jgi:hypothetical protein
MLRMVITLGNSKTCEESDTETYRTDSIIRSVESLS